MECIPLNYVVYTFILRCIFNVFSIWILCSATKSRYNSSSLTAFCLHAFKVLVPCSANWYVFFSVTSFRISCLIGMCLPHCFHKHIDFQDSFEWELHWFRFHSRSRKKQHNFNWFQWNGDAHVSPFICALHSSTDEAENKPIPGKSQQLMKEWMEAQHRYYTVCVCVCIESMRLFGAWERVDEKKGKKRKWTRNASV